MKCVPHARKELYQPSIAKGNTDHQVRGAQVSRSHVDQTQDERRQSESAEAKRGWVGDLAVLDLLVHTGLELSSKSRQVRFADGGGVDMRKRTVAETSGSFGGLVLLVGHFPIHGTAVAMAIQLFIVVAEGIASVLRVRLGGHCDVDESFEGLESLDVGVGPLRRSNDSVLYTRIYEDMKVYVISSFPAPVPLGRWMVGEWRLDPQRKTETETERANPGEKGRRTVIL